LCYEHQAVARSSFHPSAPPRYPEADATLGPGPTFGVRFSNTFRPLARRNIIDKAHSDGDAHGCEPQSVPNSADSIMGIDDANDGTLVRLEDTAPFR